MPRELNIEKLERKFTSLTKSRESIQAVSCWIMRHHEFCEEIVEHWYLALTKDQNALVMFYVANEIIQNCGKKRVPQYREAFSKVLEKAVCLEKVKEIRSDVCRILTLWKERSIFDDDFFQRLETKLNGSEVISSPSAEEDEVSELEIITKYKSGNLFDGLKRLKSVEAEAKEKEEILNYADEPQLPELSNLTVRDECLEMMKKVDSFYNLAEDCLNAINDEIKARKNVVTELKYSCIFYTAQHGDVKKVSNAYMTYGKRLKNMEKKLSEKLLIFPSAVENNSPCFSESNTQIHSSPIVGASPFDHDTSSVSRTSFKVSPSSSNEKSHDTMFSSENLKSSTSFWSKISKKASSDFPKSFEKKFEETLQKKPEQSPKQKFSKLAELFAETKSDSEKQIGPESATVDSFTGISNLKCLSSPNQKDENLPDLQIEADKQIDIPKNTELSAEKSSNQETEEKLDPLTKESSNEKRNTASAEDAYEIDFLLDESYDTKKAKSHVSVKRKIELLLQSKGKKICTDASKEKSFDGISPSNTSAENPAIEGKNSSEGVKNEDNAKLNDLRNTGIDQKEDKTSTDSKVTVPIIAQSSIKVEETPPNTISITENVKSDVKRNLSLEEKIQNVSNIFVPSSNAIEQCKEMDFLAERSDTQDSLSNNNETFGEDNAKNNSSIISEFNFDSGSSKVPENDKFSVQTPSTFFDCSLFSSISSISTEFLKNILGKNKSSPSQNAEDLTDTSSVKDSTETEKLLEGKDSEIRIKNRAFYFLESVPPTEEKLLSSNIVTKPLSQNESTENVVKNEINIKEETNIKCTASLDNISIKSNDSEQQTTIKQGIPCFGIKAEKTLLSSNDKKICSPISDIQLKPKNQFETEKADEKPNLLLTLQDVLECISNKSLSLGDNKNVWETTPLSFENCLSMYHALRSTDTKYASGSSPSSSQNVVLSQTTSESTVTSGIYSQDNLEVMDMECDSE
ncbi:hypothetical protein AVEN_90790-1 [Araneus ventricosus]|uniref:CID domain-containing protein n=1 Tax=Araneus ventricosus TaxID=182803 RepID=A0A4Y2GB88_ARAVE|nr:hypothetical protein AVEN_90790-1 [Araneus ventricosus]